MAGIPIGRLLVEQAVLTKEQVTHILDVQKTSHRPFGDLAERLYGVDPRAVEDAWVQQYVSRTGAVNLDTLEFDSDVLSVVTTRQAWQFHLMPLKRDEDSIHVATTAGNLVRCVNFATRRFNEPAHFVIASDRQIRQYLMRHYPVPQYVADYAAQMA